MKIDVQKLHAGPVILTLNHAPAFFDLSGEDFEAIENVQGELTFSVIKDKVQMRGVIKTRIRMNCVKCLEPIEMDVHKNALLYYIHQSDLKGKEDVINLEEIETSYYHGLVITPDNDIREMILVELPDYPRCNEDCKGLCPSCGINLNKGGCQCHRIQTERFQLENCPNKPFEVLDRENKKSSNILDV